MYVQAGAASKPAQRAKRSNVQVPETVSVRFHRLWMRMYVLMQSRLLWSCRQSALITASLRLCCCDLAILPRKPHVPRLQEESDKENNTAGGKREPSKKGPAALDTSPDAPEPANHKSATTQLRGSPASDSGGRELAPRGHSRRTAVPSQRVIDAGGLDSYSEESE
jgi:hypothetical protein